MHVHVHAHPAPTRSCTFTCFTWNVLAKLQFHVSSMECSGERPSNGARRHHAFRQRHGRLSRQSVGGGLVNRHTPNSGLFHNTHAGRGVHSSLFVLEELLHKRGRGAVRSELPSLLRWIAPWPRSRSSRGGVPFAWSGPTRRAETNAHAHGTCTCTCTCRTRRAEAVAAHAFDRTCTCTRHVHVLNPQRQMPNPPRRLGRGRAQRTRAS